MTRTEPWPPGEGGGRETSSPVVLESQVQNIPSKIDGIGKTDGGKVAEGLTRQT